MGPIEKKIVNYLKADGITEETQSILKLLLEEVKPVEKDLVNRYYFKGYSDKENGKSPIWDQHSYSYKSYTSNFKTNSIN
jgi:hypothetical protein